MLLSEKYKDTLKAIAWSKKLKKRQERSMKISKEVQKKYAKILSEEAEKSRVEAERKKI